MLDNMSLAAYTLQIAFLFVCVCEDESCLFFFPSKRGAMCERVFHFHVVVVIKLNWAYAEQ